MDLKETIGEIASAINDELKTTKRHGATSRITLFAGKSSRRELSRSFLYRFEMLIQRTLPEGSKGKLLFQNRSVDADVVAVDGQHLWLNLPLDVGDRIPQAYFDVDLSFILEDLKEKYSQALMGSLKMERAGKNLLLGVTSNRIPREFIVQHSDRYLSDEQSLAIEKILTAEVGAILGPPGTGKTRTLAGALIECFMNGERILVCGYTNRAVDEALEAFKRASLSCIRDHFLTAYKSGKIVRKGMSVFPESEPVIKNSDEVADSVKTELQSQLDETRRKLKDLQEQLTEMRRLAQKIEARDRIKTGYDSLRGIVETKSREYEEADKKIAHFDEQIHWKESECGALRDTGFFKRIASIRRRRELEREILGLKREMDRLKSGQPGRITELTQLRNKIRDLRGKLDELEKTTLGANLEDVKRRIQTATDELRRLERLSEDIEKSLADTSLYVINNALMIFSTLTRAHIDRELSKALFDRVFIDEASMASLPQVFLAGFKARKSIYIFGDPRQLSPICTSSKDSVRKWFARDVYQYAGLDQASSSNVAQLETQRRMPFELGSLVSHHFYGDILKHDYDGRSELPFQFPWLRGRRVALLDTSKQGAFCNRHESGRGYSRINVVHAVTALNVFKEAAQLGIASGKMAYITPYRAQAEFFGALVLKNRDVSAKEDSEFLPDLKWGTVHRFQGGEAELVLYDTCESPRQQPTRLTGGSLNVDGEDPEIDDSSRLHCVALSRAKSHLVMLANLGWLREHLAPNCKLSDLIGTLSEMGCILPVPEQHSALRLFAKSFGEKHLFTPDLGKFPYVLCNEGMFYELLEADLENCKKRLVIVSPYLSMRRISLLEAPLRHLKSKSVKVTVWTKDPLDLTTTGAQHAECARVLEELGIKVLFRSGTHEKAVIFDGATAYYGSLNPLSHRDTKETMLRVHDAAFAMALVDHLDLDEQQARNHEPETSQSAADRLFKKVGLSGPRDVLDEERGRKVLKKLRWVIAEDKGLPLQSTLWNRTIDWLIKQKPQSKDKLLECDEFRRNRSNIAGYEDFIVTVVKMIK